MEKKEFKAESRRLLDLMINSIYTHKEIFLRELISNASDACDKLCYQALTDDSVGMSRQDFQIHLTLDPEQRLLTVSDNGIGMSQEDLEENLGVIASSGTFRFRQEVGQNGGSQTEKPSGAEGADAEEERDVEESAYSDGDTPDVIGQFGVGFYSAFMVADHITVISRKYGEEKAWKWESDGADGYTISEASRDAAGTDVMVHIRPDTDAEQYGEFLQSWKIQELVRKYSDYIRFPIRMEISKTRKKEDSPEDKPEYETYQEEETLNSMVPLWQRPRSQITQDDAFKFYRDKFHDYTDPLRYTAIAVEGTVTYKALLFIPGAAPYDYYTREFQAGLQLYSNGVLIMDKCADLLGEHFRFVRGVVDSPDLSLNISRELLQHDRQLKVIARNLEKRIKSELVKLREEDREKYETFWKHFGRQIKYGVVAEYGMHKDLLSDLLMFYSSTEKKMVTLAEYADRMSGEQKYIYYAAGDSPEKVDKLPQTELLKEKGSEILYFTEEVDEFCAQILYQYREKEFRSILDQELEEGDKEKAKEAGDAHKAAFDFVKETLGDKIKEVRASARLKSHPVCLTAGEGMSFEMEKYFQSVQPEAGLHADRILELNVDHPAFQALENAVTADPDKAKSYTELLYGQALLIAGLPLEDPSAYTDLVCALMR